MNIENTNQTRRSFLLSTAGFGLLALTGCSQTNAREHSRATRGFRQRLNRKQYGLYGALPNEKFPIAAIPQGRLKKRFRRRRVRYKTREKPGTVVVDTRRFYLYHVEKGGFAMRYGVGLGRAGFAWKGRARIAWKRKWPKWTPPDEMIAREPKLARWSADNGGMPPGLTNPLGARALYIFQGKVDTLYRLHGTPEVGSIGRAVSSGCVRLTNHDVIHLYDRVRSGSRIVVI